MDKMKVDVGQSITVSSYVIKNITHKKNFHNADVLTVFIPYINRRTSSGHLFIACSLVRVISLHVKVLKCN